MQKKYYHVYNYFLALFALSQTIFAGDIHHFPPVEETPNSFDIKPIVAEDVLSYNEIEQIAATKNYFYRDHLDCEESLWHKLDRKYATKFFKHRTEIYDLPTVKQTVLQQGFPLRYQNQQLYRSDLNRHKAFGNYLPNLCLTLGDGMTGLSISNIFNGLLNPLLPQNLLTLVNSNKYYTVQKYTYMQYALDQYLSTEIQYIAVHKLIYDLEIYDFYLVHLELFTRIFPPDDAATLMVRGKMASVATDAANIRIALRLALDQLAYMMAMTQDRQALFGASKMNIANLPNFDETIQNLEDINPLYARKHEFIQEVLNRSIELRAMQELYEISQLNVGITAFGQLLGVPSRGTPAQFVFTLNYNYIPQILYSNSLKRTAQTDVENQILKIINQARISWDTYKYNTGLYAESQRSLIINRKAVKASLDKILDKGAAIDGVFLNSVIQLIDAHIKINAAVHSALRGLAEIRRLMVTEEQNILNYIPNEKNVNDALKLFLAEYGAEEDDNQYLDNMMRIIHRKAMLEKLLSGTWKGKNGEYREFSLDMLKEAVQRNFNFLLYRRWNFPKSIRFYRVLKDFVDINQIPLSSYDKEALDLLAKKVFIRKTSA